MTGSLVLSTGHVVVCDEADLPALARHTWYLHSTGGRLYARSAERVYMHRLLVGAAEVDHVNGNGLDNRRANLRGCTRSQNNANQRKHKGQSRFKGVSPRRGGWRAVITVSRKQRYLGHFVSPVSAALAYDAAARRYFGQFARVNFPYGAG